MTDVGNLRVISPPERVARVLSEAGMAEVFELTADRRAEREDRRQRDLPVAVDRRKGDRRRREAPLPLTSAGARSSAG